MATYDLTSSIPSVSSLKTGDILNCPYSGTYKSITLSAGAYKLECWGAQGGGNSGGKGGFSTGILSLPSSTTIYIIVGQAGSKNSSSTPSATYGGGAAGTLKSNGAATSGGGASDICIGQNSLYARVIVAGGGGGASQTDSLAGGVGGGTTGGNGSGEHARGNGGTQTSGGSGYGSGNNWVEVTSATFGQGGTAYDSVHSTYSCGGGGGGWYGGGGSGDDGGAGGGSGYIYTSSTASNYPSGCQLNSNYYLTSASTIAGNSSFTSPTGSSETGHSGNGYVRITINNINKPITNGSWTYNLESIVLHPSTALSTTSAWNLTGSTCKKFKMIPSSSGFLQVYSTNSNNGDTYGYITTSDVTTISSQGAPSSYQYRNDDDGEGNNFKMVIPVIANATYYLWIRPFSSSSTVSSAVISYQVINPRITGVYVKTATSTWTQVK